MIEDKLTVIVNKKEIPVSEFINYGGSENYFAIGVEGHLYHLNDYKNPDSDYALLSENFVNEQNKIEE